MWAAKLKQIVAEIEREPDKARLADLWKSAGSTLQRTGVDRMRAARAVAMRDFAGLKTIVGEVEKNPQMAVQTRYVSSRPTVFSAPVPEPIAPQAAPVAAAAVTAVVEEPGPPTDAALSSALKAFRKRLKVTQLDEQSKITSREVTGGRRASVVAISPPNQFPRTVWDTLVERGKLKRAGSGLYELTDN